jgi:hypothetical protein
LNFDPSGKFYEFHLALLMGMANYGKGMMLDYSSQQSKPTCFFVALNNIHMVRFLRNICYQKQHSYGKVSIFFFALNQAS